jgi:hypothetical protein
MPDLADGVNTVLRFIDRSLTIANATSYSVPPTRSSPVTVAELVLDGDTTA